MLVRIIAIRYDDCYVVSKLVQVNEITLAEINSALGKETIFDEFLVIDHNLQEIRIFNRTKQNRDEEEE